MLSGTLTTTITNEGSSKKIKEMERRAPYKTFESQEIEQAGEEINKTVGLGLSTADALTSYMGGKLHVKDLKD
jgi:hypothetical protein